MDLKNKVALVTGASRGIGKAIAVALAAEGAKLMLAARNRDRLQQIAETISGMGTEAEVFAVDLHHEDQIKNMIQATVKRFGRLDVLVNNAGLGYSHSIAETSTAEWDEMFAVNLRAPFIATREALPHLRKAGESIVVNVASLAGKNFLANMGGYSASKWALRAFSHSLMLEERKRGLRVLAIFPGSVATDFGGVASTTEECQKRSNIIYPEDVAESILCALKMPQRSMISEIDIRPSNPGS